MYLSRNETRGYSMSLKQQTIAIAAAAFFVTAGSVSVSAQENCCFMYQPVMEAYQVQSPHYGQMVNHYNARCLSGASAGPSWGGGHRHPSDAGQPSDDN